MELTEQELIDVIDNGVNFKNSWSVESIAEVIIKAEEEKKSNYNPIYAKKLKQEEREAFWKYYHICGFEPHLQEQIDSGEMTPKEVFEDNLYWLDCVSGDCSNINFPEYCDNCGEIEGKCICE